MLIEVWIEGWQQACCGDHFALGDRVAWMLVSGDPAARQPGAHPRFDEEHHGQTPDGVPHLEVAGTVAAIDAVRYAQHVVPGTVRSFRLDFDDATFHPIDDVDRYHEGDDGDDETDGYRVLLEIADDAVLPEFVAVISPDIVDVRQEQTQRRLPDMVDEHLGTLADEAEKRFGEVARISRAHDHPAVTIEPHRVGASPVAWVRRETDDPEPDELEVVTHGGTWAFPATIEGVEAELRPFLDAVAAGGVSELVPSISGDELLSITEVVAADGRRWTSTESRTWRDGGEGVFLVAGFRQHRLGEGVHRYLPW